MGSYDDPELAGGDRPRRRWRVVLAVLLALAVGVGGGYLLRYTTAGQPTPAPAAGPPASSAQPPPNGPPCLQAADVGSALLAQVQQGVAAIGRLDPQGLQRVLDEIQRLQARLQQAVSSCRDRTNPPSSAPASG